MNIMSRAQKDAISLDKIFYPRSIAVIGASNDINKIGGFIFSQIKNLSKINTYPINVKEDKIQKIKAYQNILDVRKNIDLAIIVIPRDFVLSTLNDCAVANVKNIIIISAGFKEVNQKGAEIEEEIKKVVAENNINLIGPNCLGILNAEINLNCSFAKEVPQRGDIALVSQSGAVIDAIIDWSFKQNVGFSKVVSIGNMAGVDNLKILEYLKDDPKTKSIVFYMETLDNGEKFAKLLKETSKKKPVIIIKPGNSDNAKAAIGSHTGSLAQDNILVETLIKENNGIFVKSLNELFNVLIGLKSNLPTNKKLLIITNAGGPGVIATDFASEYNFELYKLNEFQKEKLSFLPGAASLNNPIDMLGDAKSDRYSQTLDAVDKMKDFSNILILLTPQVMTDNLNIAKEILKIGIRTKKSIYSCFLGGKEISSATQFLDNNGIANFLTPSDAITTMNYLYNYNTFKYDEQIEGYELDVGKIDRIKKILKHKHGLLDFELTQEIMDLFKIKLPNKKIVKSITDFEKLNLIKNKKYVLKVDSNDIIHKKDIGGVKVGIRGDEVREELIEMRNSLLKITNEFIITIEEQYEGIETIVGLKSEAGLGSFIIFGMGGTYVEVVKDINISSCPLNKSKVEALISGSKVFTLLNGFRGTKPIDFKHLYETLIRISYIQKVFPEIKEVDFNPIICNENGIYLVDVKLLI